MSYRHMKSIVALLSLAVVSRTALAHEAWVQPGPGPEYPIEYGDFTPEAYPVSKVKEVKAFDGQHHALKTRVTKTAYGATAKVAGTPSMITLLFDNGFYTKTADGISVNLPKSGVPGGTTTSHPVKYGKTILKWDETAYQPAGLLIEIVPVGTGAPKHKSPMTVQVLYQGKPLADAEVESVGIIPEGKGPHTDADGKVTLDMDYGIQRLAVQHKLETSGETGVDSKSVTAALLFVIE